MLTNWIVALKLLIHYRLRFNPFISIGDGEYTTYNSRFTNKTLKSVISANPFDPDFMETFLHELGHHIYKISRGDDKIIRNLLNKGIDYEMYSDTKEWYAPILEEEVFASKFAYKSSKKLKIQCSKAKLLQWFYTYTGAGYNYLTNSGVDRTAYTNHVSKLINKLERA